MKSESKTTPRKRLDTLRRGLMENFVERDEIIPVLLGLVLAKQNVFLLGPPGTGKSALAEAICQSFGNGNYFRHLMSRFTKPDELFGPFDIKSFREGKQVVLPESYMPTATIVFIDELWKANSSVLTTLLEILNEHTFKNGTVRKEVPLRMAFGASNELPEDTELEALYDRFVARFFIDSIKDRENMKKLMTGKVSGKPVDIKFTQKEVDDLAEQASKIAIDESMTDTILDIKEALYKEGITASDRRWKQIKKTLPYIAFAMGSTAVDDDCLIDVLPDMVWRTPEQRKVAYRIVSEIANPVGAKAQEIIDAADQTVKDAMAAGGEQKEDDTMNPEVASIYSSARLTLQQQIDKAIALDPKANNGRVRDAVSKLREYYAEIMERVANSANLGGFNGNKVTKKIDAYLGEK